MSWLEILPANWLPVLAGGVAIMMAVEATHSFFGGENRLSRRLPRAAEAAPGTEGRASLLGRFRAAGSSSAPKPQPADSLAQRLAAAGFEQPRALLFFRIIRVGLGVAAGLAAFAALMASGIALGADQLFGVSVGSGASVYLLPPIYLSRRARQRQGLLRLGFPDSLDLMQVCVEAGLALDAAIGRVGDELAVAHPLLARHYKRMSAELRAGKGHEEALQAFAERIDLDEARSFASLIIQSETLGSSISDALRTYAEDMRHRRLMAAEAKAQQLSVKLSIPLIVLILPALILVITTPAAQKIARTFLPMVSDAP